MTIYFYSSLAKIVPGCMPSSQPLTHASMLMDELYSLQVGYYYEGESIRTAVIRVFAEEDEAFPVEVYTEELVVCDTPVRARCHDLQVSTAPSIAPDVLRPVRKTTRLYSLQWRAVWVLIDGTKLKKPGSYTLICSIEDESGKVIDSKTLPLIVANAHIPSQKTFYTCWQHSDCVAAWHNVEIFSEQHWKLLEQYIAMAGALESIRC